MDARVTTRHHAFRLRNIAGFVVWCALTALMLVASETASSANPFFFSKTGQDCKFCHQHGREMSGVEGLNDTGRAFLQTFKRCPDCALRDFAAGNRSNQGGTVAPSTSSSSSRPAPPPASSDKFTFHVCNQSRHEASVAVSYRVSRNPDSFHAQGWTNLHPGACSNLGPFPKGGFWYYAFSKPTGRQWSGNVELCVDKSAGFSRTYGKGHQCREDRVRFYFKNVDAGEYSWNLGN